MKQQVVRCLHDHDRCYREGFIIFFSQKCVKRRAKNSVAPYAEKHGVDKDYVVDKVFERCYADVVPLRTATKVYID